MKLLNSNNVEYLLVGGWAVGFYGYSRFTADMDVFVGISKDNVLSVKRALHEFGVPDFDISMLNTKGNVFRIGRTPLRIEVINEITGVSFLDAYTNKEYVELEDDFKVPIISIDDLFTNKSSTGRTKDQLDIEELRKFLD
ncbi:MAG: hypothetical protein OCD01_11240 [Fibrobacterales bacterium]